LFLSRYKDYIGKSLQGHLSSSQLFVFLECFCFCVLILHECLGLFFVGLLENLRES
jgi:hypothetical protein